MELRTNEIHLWLASSQQINDAQLLADYEGILNPQELKRLKRFSFPRHQKQFLVTRALVRTVLASYMAGVKPGELKFGQNKYGKPHLDKKWLKNHYLNNASGLHFNLSHSQGLVALAVTGQGEDEKENDKALGLDTEYTFRKADILKLSERYFSSQEHESLVKLKPEFFNDRFFDLWTLKEAYIKACGMGLKIPLEDFSFAFGNEESTPSINISFSSQRQDDPDNWRLWQLQYEESYRLALALKVPGEASDIQIKTYQSVPLRESTEINLQLIRQSRSGAVLTQI